MQLDKTNYFREDDDDLKKQMDELFAEDKRGCHVYVLSAQASDMKRVLSIAKEKEMIGLNKIIYCIVIAVIIYRNKLNNNCQKSQR